MSFSFISRRQLAVFAAATLAGAAFSTAAVAAPQTRPTTVQVKHAKGSTAVSGTPKRVVVYDLGALDAMHAMGIPVAGVPKAQFPAYLSTYATGKVPVAGTLFVPDYDVLSRIKPDLIIVGGRSASAYDILSKIAPTVDFSVDRKQLVQDVERNVTELGKLFGKQAQGAALVKQIQTELADLRQLSGGAAPGLLLMAVNERIMPQDATARFGLLFDVLGAKSAITAKDLPPRGTRYSFDDVAKLNPEWIYVIDRNAGTGSAAGGGEMIPSEKVFDNPQVKATAAGQKGQVVFLDPKGWYLMGSTAPTALLGNIAQLKKAYQAAKK